MVELSNVTSQLPGVEASLRDFSVSIYERSLEILTAPKHTPDMIWILVPLILTLILMEFYFSRYAEEELGWNTAFGNSMVLIFVSIDLARKLFNTQFLAFNYKTIIVGIVALFGFFLTFIDFFHLLPKKIAYKISSKLPINYMAYVAIILVYTDTSVIPLDNTTLSAFLAIFLALLITTGFMHALVPKVRTAFAAPRPPPTLKEESDEE